MSNIDNKFMNQMSVIQVHSYAPKNKFQSELIRLMSPLHGMCFPTALLEDMTADLMCLTNALTVKYPRRTTQARFCLSASKHDLYGKECPACWVEDTKDLRDGDACRVVTAYFYPLQGTLYDVTNDSDSPQMFATPFFGDKVQWAVEYNDLIAMQGGKV